ncbi:MAG: beta-ketoacyl-[acyl-carrier-protein] synthase family protein [Acidobacteriota bacterium]|jgi:3-oxoacyl-[acyl-carrier-protein] synthase II
MARRVVVSGLGLVTSLGTGREQFWRSLLDGRSGIAPVESFDTSAYEVHLGGEIRDFCAADHVRHQDPALLGRASQLAIGAAHLALTDAAIDSATLDPRRVGVAMGTTSGEPREVERFDDRFLDDQLSAVGSEFMDRYPCHMIAENVAGEFGFGAGSIMLPTACAAGNYAIAYALDALRCGRADLMLAGGADSFSRITYTGFARLGAIAPDCCRPFDRERKGMIPGEGAAVLVLEPLDAAKLRGARIYAEVAGCGLSCDAHHMTGAHPEGAGAARAMQEALRHSGLRPRDVSYISAHGTGTENNDRLETLAVKRVFGDDAYAIPMSSIKSMLGHTMGAASAIEAAACALALSSDLIPPTINYATADPECDLDYVPNSARQRPVKVAMNNAYAFGGNNASLVLREFSS